MSSTRSSTSWLFASLSTALLMQVCFGVGLFFLSGLCAMKWGAFVFFAAW